MRLAAKRIINPGLVDHCGTEAIIRAYLAWLAIGASISAATGGGLFGRKLLNRGPVQGQVKIIGRGFIAAAGGVATD